MQVLFCNNEWHCAPFTCEVQSSVGTITALRIPHAHNTLRQTHLLAPSVDLALDEGVKGTRTLQKVSICKSSLNPNPALLVLSQCATEEMKKSSCFEHIIMWTAF